MNPSDVDRELEDAWVRGAALAEVTRPANAALAGVATAIGAFVAGWQTEPAVVAAVVTAFGTGAGNSVNDYYDADIDAVNQPERPIPSGRISRTDAVALATALFAAALLATVVYLPLLAVAIGVVNLVLLVVYSSHLKRLPLVGNLAVAFLAGSAFLFGGAAVGNAWDTVVLFGIAALVTLGREVVKDLEDVEGDREMGARTVPIAWGRKHALAVAAGSVGVGVGLAPLPYLFQDFGGVYLAAVTVASIVALYGVAVSASRRGRGQKSLKIAMTAALLAFALPQVF